MTNTSHSIDGKKMALLLWYFNKQTDAEEVVKYTGTAHWKDESLSFHYGDPKKILQLNSEQVQRIKKIPSGLEDIFQDCVYELSLRVQDLPDREDVKSIIPTGLKWID